MPLVTRWTGLSMENKGNQSTVLEKQLTVGLPKAGSTSVWKGMESINQLKQLSHYQSPFIFNLRIVHIARQPHHTYTTVSIIRSDVLVYRLSWSHQELSVIKPNFFSWRERGQGAVLPCPLLMNRWHRGYSQSGRLRLMLAWDFP